MDDYTFIIDWDCSVENNNNITELHEQRKDKYKKSREILIQKYK